MITIKANKYNTLALYAIFMASIILIINTGLTIPVRSWLKIHIPFLDKVGHFFGMGILTFLALKASHKPQKKAITPRFILGIIAVTTFATI